jgi:hypothetical protein
MGPAPSGFSMLPWLLMGMGAFSNLVQGSTRERGRSRGSRPGLQQITALTTPLTAAEHAQIIPLAAKLPQRPPSHTLTP